MKALNYVAALVFTATSTIAAAPSPVIQPDTAAEPDLVPAVVATPPADRNVTDNRNVLTSCKNPKIYGINRLYPNPSYLWASWGLEATCRKWPDDHKDVVNVLALDYCMGWNGEAIVAMDNGNLHRNCVMCRLEEDEMGGGSPFSMWCRCGNGDRNGPWFDTIISIKNLTYSMVNNYGELQCFNHRGL
ncbi:hypothetical protein F5Y15DRAFT_221073 [Xylariaceae sp. FL0016]|nr:hypothetical protein F5Y15DRAFT_221073 [Xylariaceae sp. FL0016]